MKKLINFLPILSVPLAILWPEGGVPLFDYLLWMLVLLLFASFLNLDLNHFIKAISKPHRILFFSLIILLLPALIGAPIIYYFFPDYFVGALILMLMPAAIASPAIALMYEGSISFAATNSILSNLLVPFTLPFVVFLLLGTQIEIDIWEMFLRLLIIIFPAFFLSFLIRHFYTDFIKKISPSFTYFNLLLFFLITYGALSPFVDLIKKSCSDWKLWTSLFLVHLFFILIAKVLIRWMDDKKEKISLQINFIFPNTALAIVIAQQYFGINEVFFLVLAEICFVLFIALFKYIK